MQKIPSLERNWWNIFGTCSWAISALTSLVVADSLYVSSNLKTHTTSKYVYYKIPRYLASISFCVEKFCDFIGEPLTTFAKNSILDVRQGSEYASWFWLLESVETFLDENRFLRRSTFSSVRYLIGRLTQCQTFDRKKWQKWDLWANISTILHM